MKLAQQSIPVGMDVAKVAEQLKAKDELIQRAAELLRIPTAMGLEPDANRFVDWRDKRDQWLKDAEGK